jgi:hypothetical protein
VGGEGNGPTAGCFVGLRQEAILLHQLKHAAGINPARTVLSPAATGFVLKPWMRVELKAGRMK